MKCEATEAACVCDLEQDHNGPHHCTRDECDGQWFSDPFQIVRFPAIFYSLFGDDR